MCAKYRMQTCKAMIPIEFPVYTLPENTKSIIKKKSEKLMLSSKCCHFCQNIIFLVSNIVMQMFKVSSFCMQSIRCSQQKLWYKLNSQCMHYLRTQNPFERRKVKNNAKFKMLSFCQKIFSHYPISSSQCSRCLH